ncbi:Calmodulin-binding transcription activator 4 [Linum grandiflorum]
MLEPPYDHVVLVHYRDINEGMTASGSLVQSSPGVSFHLGPSPSSNPTHNQGSTQLISNSHGPYTNSSSPGSAEVTSEIHIKGNEGFATEKIDVNQYLRSLKKNLSLDDDMVAGLGLGDEGSLNQPDFSGYETQTYTQDGPSENAEVQRQPNNFLIQNPGNNLSDHHAHMLENDSGLNESTHWNDVFDPSPSCMNFKENMTSGLKSEPIEEYKPSQWLNFGQNNYGAAPEVGKSEVQDLNPDSYTMSFSHGQPDSQLSIGQHNKFTIRKISPEWGYCNEITKVLIVGLFHCDPSESAWKCMFGDKEVPLEIFQEGVLQCNTPLMPPGKVSVCITSGNRQPCSEIGQFEFRKKSSSDALFQLLEKSSEEMLSLVRLVEMLLSGSSLLKLNDEDPTLNQQGLLKSDEDSWVQVIEALLIGTGTTSDTVYWLLEQLLKDKLHRWLSSKYRRSDDQDGCFLSKKEQGIIHMIAGLGFEWALTPILNHGVSVDFRDINGWTALHWAARFGREKMVAALIASGASPGAVTDPNSEDPAGKTPASIAAINGHHGLAGYLSELALTTHLSCLTLEESELSKGSAEVEAERTVVDSISKANFPASYEDQVSINTTLAAVRNSAQAAARIQSAFRAHSFRKRQQREAAVRDEYGIRHSEIQELSALSRMAFGNARDYSTAALSIQKKYRGWKGRQDFLTLKKKVVRIQAHVRGYQVRKHYRVICWAVGIIDKVVLRWRRKGAGLRNLRNKAEPIVEDEEEDEDILKIFRKQKVDGAIDEAVSRVLSMVHSPDAREQYQRMLERYKQAKAELATTSEAGTFDRPNNTNESEMDDDDLQQYFQ